MFLHPHPFTGEALTLAFGGLLVRTTSVFIITLFLKFTWKERLFVVIAWIPKATIQAAISGYPVTVAAHAGGNIEDCELKNSLVQSVSSRITLYSVTCCPQSVRLSRFHCILNVTCCPQSVRLSRFYCVLNVTCCPQSVRLSRFHCI